MLIFPVFIIDVASLFLLGCVINGVAGDGTTQGTCASSTEVCTAAGQCLGNIITLTNPKLLKLY